MNGTARAGNPDRASGPKVPASQALSLCRPQAAAEHARAMTHFTAGAPAASSEHPTVQPGSALHVLLADGSMAEFRHAEAGDFEAVRTMHAQMSPDNLYLRFFSLSPQAPEHEARRLCRPAAKDHVALLALVAGRLAGVASYELVATTGHAEIAFAVADDLHGHGIATLLLRQLVAVGLQNRVAVFDAETLRENYQMQHVLAAAGLPAERHFADGEVGISLSLEGAG
jgi:RimJ/RimL family protein N-acetyltransferase